MTNMKFLIILIFAIPFTALTQRSYKELMKDNTVNFYEVCEAAEAYFETHDKDKKGSGWTGYQRWKKENEAKFYPTGDRSGIDFYLPEKAYEQFVEDNPAGATRALFDDGWLEVGPVTIDSITGHYAPGLGRIESFYVNPEDEDEMYFGSRSGGFWKTEDGGATWEGGSTDFLFACGVNAIAVSPTNSDSILINIRNSSNGVTHGIYRSIDGGDTWNLSNYNPDILGEGGLGDVFYVNRIAYHPTVPDLVFVAASDGLYRSEDNLVTWVKVTNGSISDIEFHPTNSDIIYIYDYYYWGDNKNKVLRSTDNGITFTGSAEIVGNANNTSVQLDVSPICEDCIYFASGNGIWKSFDAGLTFDFVSNPEGGSQGFAVSDVDTSFMTYGYVDCFASSDGGADFDQVTWWGLWAAPFDGDQYIHADLREAECLNGVFYVSTDGYFAKSEDNGTTWERLCDDVGIRENYTLGASQSNHYRTMVGSQDNGTSIKLQSGWIEFAGADGMEAIIHPLNDDWMISSYQYGGRRRTFDGGQSQTNVTPAPDADWVAPMAYDPNDHMTVYHFGEDIYKSEDYGNSWTITGSPSFSGNIQEAAIAENNTDIIVVSRWDNLELSMDGGVTFTNISGTLPGYTISDIAFDPNDDNTFVVTFRQYHNDGLKVFITHNLGSTWTNITANVGNMPIRGAVIDHSDESYIYLAAEIGVYVKAMDDTDWELYNADLPNCTVNELEIVNGSNTLRAATWGRGVWEYTLKDRKDYPAIVKTSITDMPTFTVPAEETEQYVTSLISYDWVIASAYVKWSVDEPTFDNTIDMENTMDSTWVSESPIPSYPAGTKIYFKVFAQGSFEEVSETYKFMYTVQPFEYCESYGNMAYETAVTLIDFSELNNPSGKLAPYTSYIGMDTATVYRTEDYDLTMNINTDGPYTIHGNAWIDWNRDGDFTDSGEDYNLGDAFDTEDGPSSLSPLTITIPADAHLGKTTMRVAAKYPSDAGPCETGFDGEVEDYTIFIKGLPEVDYEISASEICAGETVSFEYTGTPLDSLSWTLTNGVEEYTSTDLSGSVTLDSPGEYDLSMIGYEGGHLDGGTWTSTVIVHPDYAVTDLVEICEGETYILGTQTITEAGEYEEPFETIFGCDSMVTLTVEVTELDVSVLAADYELTANATGVSYQWLDCDEGWTPIDGETDQSFEPIENGNYAVEITNDECIDTSECFAIVALSLNDFGGSGIISIYPNPTSGNFIVAASEIQPNLDIEVRDVAGRLVFSQSYQNQSQAEINLDVADGIYYVIVQSGEEDNEIIIKLVVN